MPTKVSDVPAPTPPPPSRWGCGPPEGGLQSGGQGCEGLEEMVREVALEQGETEVPQRHTGILRREGG